MKPGNVQFIDSKQTAVTYVQPQVNADFISIQQVS